MKNNDSESPIQFGSPVNIINISWKNISFNKKGNKIFKQEKKSTSLTSSQVTTVTTLAKNETNYSRTNGNILHLNDNSIIDKIEVNKMIKLAQQQHNNLRRNSDLNLLIFNNNNNTQATNDSLQTNMNNNNNNSSNATTPISISSNSSVLSRNSRISRLISKTACSRQNSLQNLPLISQKMRQRKVHYLANKRQINENQNEANAIGNCVSHDLCKYLQDNTVNTSLKSLGTMMNAAQSLSTAPSALYEFLWDERIKAHLDCYSALKNDNKILYGYETIDNYTKYWYISENGNYYGGLI